MTAPVVVRPAPLDELFHLARRYRGTAEFEQLLRFVVRFRWYSPFNAMLVHLQMPGAVFVAPADRWLREYGRRIEPGAKPLVILRPMGPVMFVFDVSGTYPTEGARPLPMDVEAPFEVEGGLPGGELGMTIENGKRDGVSVVTESEGSQAAGSIRAAVPGRYLNVLAKNRPEPARAQVSVRYEVMLNGTHTAAARYATLVHELAHLYCGHLGSPDERWWPNRQGLTREEQEFEAEAVSYLVCGRLGVKTRSEAYLGQILEDREEVPEISPESVMRVAGLIESMGRKRLPLRKERAGERGGRE